MTARVANKKPLGQVPMCPLLRPLYKDELGPWTILPNRTVTCGSAEDNDIVLKASGIGPHHCHFEFNGSVLRIWRDEGRVWVNDLPVSSDVSLSMNDTINIGAVSIVIDEAPLALPPIQRRPESTVAEADVSFVGDSSLRFESAFPGLAKRNPLQFSHYAQPSGVELERLQQDLSTREVILRRNEERCAELLLELEQLRSEYSRTDVAEAAERARAHEEELQSSRQEIAAEQQRNQQVADELQLLRQQLDKQKLALDSQAEELEQQRPGDPENQCNDDARQELLAENRLLRSQLADLQTEVIRLRRELEQAAAQLSQYAASLEDQTVELHFIRSQLAEKNAAPSLLRVSTQQAAIATTQIAEEAAAADLQDDTSEPVCEDNLPAEYDPVTGEHIACGSPTAESVTGESVTSEPVADEPENHSDELDPPLPPAVSELLDRLNEVAMESADDVIEADDSDQSIAEQLARITSDPESMDALPAAEISPTAQADQTAAADPEERSDDDDDFPAGRLQSDTDDIHDAGSSAPSSGDVSAPEQQLDTAQSKNAPDLAAKKPDAESTDAVDIDSYVERLLARQAQAAATPPSASQMINPVIIEPRGEAEERRGRRSIISFIEEYMSGRIQFEGDEPLPLRSQPTSEAELLPEPIHATPEGYRPRSVVSVRAPIDFGRMRLENEGVRNLSAHCAEQALMSYFLRREQSGLVMRTAVVAGFLMLIAFGRPAIHQLTGMQEFSRWAPVLGLLISCAELTRKLMRVIRIRRGMTHVSLRRRGVLPTAVTPVE